MSFLDEIRTVERYSGGRNIDGSESNTPGGSGFDPIKTLNSSFDKATKKLTITAGNSGTKTTDVVIDIDTDGGIPEAPKDGKIYGRKDAGWTEVPTSPAGSGLGGTLTGAIQGTAVKANGSINERPSEYKLYAVSNAGVVLAKDSGQPSGANTLYKLSYTGGALTDRIGFSVKDFTTGSTLTTTDLETFELSIEPTQITGGGSGGNDLSALLLDFKTDGKLESTGTLADGTKVVSNDVVIDATTVPYSETKTVKEKIDEMQLAAGVQDVQNSNGTSFVDDYAVAVIPNFAKSGTEKSVNPNYLYKSYDGNNFTDYSNIAEFLDNHSDEELVVMSSKKFAASKDAGGATFGVRNYQESSVSAFATTSALVRTFDCVIPTSPTSGSASAKYNLKTIAADGGITATGDQLTIEFGLSPTGKVDAKLSVGSTEHYIVVDSIITAGEYTIPNGRILVEKESNNELEIILQGGLLCSPATSALPNPTYVQYVKWLGGDPSGQIIEFDGGTINDDNHKQMVDIPATAGLLTQEIYEELASGGSGSLVVEKTDLVQNSYFVSCTAQDTSLCNFTITSLSAKAERPTDIDQLTRVIAQSDAIVGVSHVPSDGANRSIIGQGRYNNRLRLNVADDMGQTYWVDLNAGANITTTSTKLGTYITNVEFK